MILEDLAINHQHHQPLKSINHPRGVFGKHWTLCEVSLE